MLTSPFGETFHFRTALSLGECQRRIDTLEASILGETNYSKQAVSARRKNRFTLWENQYLRAPRLKGRLLADRGWTVISGRAGANLESLFWALGFLLLVALLIAFDAVFQRGSIGVLQASIVSIFGSAYLYWKFWEDPHAGHLIDQLQGLLEAESIQRLGVRPPVR